MALKTLAAQERSSLIVAGGVMGLNRGGWGAGHRAWGVMGLNRVSSASLGVNSDHIPAVHTMVAVVLLEGAPTATMANNQARTTHQLACGAALREVYPAALRGRTTADLPRLPPS